MKRPSSVVYHLPLFQFLSVSTAVLAAVVAAGCGSASSSSPATPVLPQTTTVTLLLTSTANDQLSQFDVNFNSLSLTSQSGKTVNVFSTNQSPEFIHLNGRLEPLLTVSIPQDVYTSASATIGGSIFGCLALDPSSNGLVTAFFSQAPTPTQAIVNVPAPLTIVGAAMGLSLDMQISQSASYASCSSTLAYSITPTFNLSAVSFSSPVAEPLLDGQVVAVNAANNSFSVLLAGGQLSPAQPATANGQMLSVNTSNSTVYQGLDGFSALTVGTFVDMDAAIQSDGSQLATRIAVEDADISNLTVATGPVAQTMETVPVLFDFGRQYQGFLWNAELAGNTMPYSFGNATFQISGRFTNLQNLPFTAQFNATNVFPGQNVYVTSHATSEGPYPEYVPLTTITLIPQTINGTVNGISSQGGFTTYAVTLAPYDLIPALSVQPGQTTVLTNPNSVIVYVDSDTQMLTTRPVAMGGVLRLTGMLFNDNGTLRMDCGQVNDGVPE